MLALWRRRTAPARPASGRIRRAIVTDAPLSHCPPPEQTGHSPARSREGHGMVTLRMRGTASSLAVPRGGSAPRPTLRETGHPRLDPRPGRAEPGAWHPWPVKRQTRDRPRTPSRPTRRFRRAKSAVVSPRDRTCGRSTLILLCPHQPHRPSILQRALYHGFSMVPPNSRSPAESPLADRQGRAYSVNT